MPEWRPLFTRCSRQCCRVSENRARCHCGWYGPQRSSSARAEEDRHGHAPAGTLRNARERGCPECIEREHENDRRHLAQAWLEAAELIEGQDVVAARRRLLLRRSARVAQQARPDAPWRLQAAEMRARLRAWYSASESTCSRRRIAELEAQARDLAAQAKAQHARGRRRRALAIERMAAAQRVVAARGLAAREAFGPTNEDVAAFWERSAEELSVAARELAGASLEEAALWIEPYAERARQAGTLLRARRADEEGNTP